MNNTIFAACLISIASGLVQAQVPQNLDEALKADSSGYQEASATTRQLWENVLTTLEKNEYDKAPALIQQPLESKVLVCSCSYRIPFVPTHTGNLKISEDHKTVGFSKGEFSP